MQHGFKPLVVILFLLSLVISCNGGKMPEKAIVFGTIKDIPTCKWERLSQKRIYFGHHSVGFNIVDGVRDLMKESPQIKLNIVETYSTPDFKNGVFAHSRVGRNTNPKSKIDEFQKFMEGGIGDKADIAFFKFCYVDVTTKTDVQKVFDEYKNALARIENEFAKTTFVHVTIPLRITKTTSKTKIKKFLGKKNIWEYEDNIKRNEFNELLRKEYDGKEPIFDLAKIESTYPDGKRSYFTKAGKTYYSLVPDYTCDGGHLNETGRKIVAEQLLLVLANQCQ
jgi:hypothetical protein